MSSFGKRVLELAEHDNIEEAFKTTCIECHITPHTTFQIIPYNNSFHYELRWYGKNIVCSIWKDLIEVNTTNLSISQTSVFTHLEDGLNFLQRKLS